jgi:arginine/lysine/histidine/glutamine transport system substrate-binding/permease protein
VAESIQVILDALPALLTGAVVTLQLTLLSAIVGMVGGSLLALARLSASAPIRWFARIYIDFFRGTPLLVQLFMIYFGLPALMQQAFGIPLRWDRFTAGVVALGFNSAAYIAEIMRAGIQSIDLGQSEASQSLGLGSVQTLRYVVFPQALRRMLPPLGNEFITMLKDTSLVAVIGFEELLRQGQLIVARNYQAFQIYLAVAITYLILTILSSRAFSFLEDWMNPIKRAKRASNQAARS